MMMDKSNQLRLKGKLVLGQDPMFDSKIATLQQLVINRKQKLENFSKNVKMVNLSPGPPP